LFTCTETALDVALCPSESLTAAVNVCDPSDTPVVSQLTEYGAAVKAEPRLLPSSRNWTEATVAGEVAAAVAVTVTDPETVALFDGLVMLAVGGVPPVPPLPIEYWKFTGT
jgi:hypothetical protein